MPVTTFEYGSTSLDVCTLRVFFSVSCSILLFIGLTDESWRLSVCFASVVFDRSLDDKLCPFALLSSIVVLCVA